MKALSKILKLFVTVQDGKVNYEKLALYFLLITVLVRFYNLSGGIVLGEPDEVTHQEIVTNFHKSPIPQYSGGPWYYELPLYPFLGFLFSFIFPQDYLALRLVSLLATGLLVFGIYFYVKNKVSNLAGFFAALIFSISPMSVFYSRIGMLDASVVSFSFISLIFFDLAHKERRISYSVISGLFLGAAILTKYSALVFVVVPVIYFAYFLLKKVLDILKATKSSVFELKNVVIIGLTSSILVLPTSFLLILSNKYLFKIHLLTNLGLLHDTWWLQGKEYGIAGYINLIPWWLTLGVILLLPIGVCAAVKDYKKWSIFLGSLALLLVVVVSRTPFYPRYFYLIVPFLAVLCGLSLDTICKRVIRNLHVAIILASLFLVFTVVPTTIEAMSASHHSLIEDSAVYVSANKETGPFWLFSTYWPNFYNSLLKEVKVGWLADSAWEASAFTDSSGLSSFDVLKTKGGVVLIEDLYSGNTNFKNPTSRTVAREKVLSENKPSKIIYDKSSNFPHFKHSINSVRVYIF